MSNDTDSKKVRKFYTQAVLLALGNHIQYENTEALLKIYNLDTLVNLCGNKDARENGFNELDNAILLYAKAKEALNQLFEIVDSPFEVDKWIESVKDFSKSISEEKRKELSAALLKE